MDENYYEIAGANEQAQRDAGVLRARRANAAPADWDGETCYDCEGDIPAERLKHGFCRCVECQTLKERIEKRRAA